MKESPNVVSHLPKPKIAIDKLLSEVLNIRHVCRTGDRQDQDFRTMIQSPIQRFFPILHYEESTIQFDKQKLINNILPYVFNYQQIICSST